MYPGLEDLQGEPPLPSKASVNFEIIGAKDGDTEIISVNSDFNLEDGVISQNGEKIADISYPQNIVGARVDFVENISFDNVVELLKGLTYENQGEATGGPRIVRASLVNEFEDTQWQAETEVIVTGINDPIQISGIVPIDTYLEGQEPVLVFKEINISDPDNNVPGTTQIIFKNDTFTDGDVLSTPESDKFTSNYSNINGNLNIVANEGSTNSDLQEYLRQITFHSDSKDPVQDHASRVIELVMSDLGGAPVNPLESLTTKQQVTIDVIETNDPPSVTGSDISLTEPNDLSSLISLNIGNHIDISDQDDVFLQEVKISIDGKPILPSNANAVDTFYLS